MNYISIEPVSTSDFLGVSTVLAVAGCIHKCESCWAKTAWKYTAGKKLGENLDELYTALSKPYIDNLVIQGGDVMAPRNIRDGLDLCARIRDDFPDKNIVIFTGYSMLEIQSDSELSKFLSVSDYIVDGKFIKELSGTPKAQFRGSRNQRIYRIIDGVPELDERFNFNA